MANTITHKLLYEEATRRGWKATFFGKHDLFLHVSNETGNSCIYRGSRPTTNSANGSYIVRDKYQTIRFITHLGYSLPACIETDSLQELSRFLKQEKCIVIKPLDSDKSQGVTVGITQVDQIEKAFNFAQDFSSGNSVIAQKQLEGTLYRLFVLDGEIVAVSERHAAKVVGDGTSTVEQLVKKLNDDPKRGIGSSYALQKISLEDVTSYIGKEKLKEVLKQGEECRVSAIESVSAGGSSTTIVDKPHDTWKTFVKLVTKELGLVVAGFDVIAQDLAEPLVDKYVPLLEVNSMPGFKIHEYPTYGESIHLAPLLLDATIKTTQQV